MLVTAGGPGAFLAVSIFAWDGHWPLLARPVLLWLIFVSGWKWWILGRDRRERREVEQALRRLDPQGRRGSRVHEERRTSTLRPQSGGKS